MQKRFTFFIVANSILILIWGVYLFTIQMFDPYGFERSKQVRYTPAKELQAPLRGNIYDKNQELLVRTVSYYQIDYDRSTLDKDNIMYEYQTLATIISENTSLTYNYVLNRLSSVKGFSSVYISDRIRETDLVSLRRGLDKQGYSRGLISKPSFQQRIYPKDSLAARILGTTQRTSDLGSRGSTVNLSQLEGLSGLELSHNRDLQGVYGWRKLFYDARNNPIFIPSLRNQQVINGNNIILTLDSRIQEILEMNLREGLETFGAKNAIGIFMNPKTGEIYAMASISENDKLISSAEIRTLPNLAVSLLFEPGSTIKPFTALAALDNNLFSVQDTLDCRIYRLPGRTIRDSHQFEDLSFSDVVVLSSNVGISKVAEELGENALYNMLISLGFGNRIGSDFAGESAGLFRKVRNWQGFSLHSISFGQEIAVTPLQLVASYAALANKGVLMRPYIVDSIVDENDRLIKKNKPSRIRTLSNKFATDSINSILVDAVKYGTGKATSLPYITVAGKTGTAEKQVSGSVGYTEDAYVSNFAGYFPAEDPQMVGVIIYDEPAYYYHYASMSAAVTFRKITEQILSLPDCQIMPTAYRIDRKFVSMPQVTGKSLHKAKGILKESGVQYQIIGSSNNETALVVNQYPKDGVQVVSGQQVAIVIEDKEKAKKRDYDESEIINFTGKMPDLIGLTVRQAVHKAKKNNINLVVQGRGKITQQSISRGRKVDYGDECIVKAR